MGRLGVVQLVRACRHNTTLLNLRLDVHDLPVQQLLGTVTFLHLNGSWVPDGVKWWNRKEERKATRLLGVLDTVFISEAIKYNRAMTHLECVLVLLWGVAQSVESTFRTAVCVITYSTSVCWDRITDNTCGNHLAETASFLLEANTTLTTLRYVL